MIKCRFVGGREDYSLLDVPPELGAVFAEGGLQLPRDRTHTVLFLLLLAGDVLDLILLKGGLRLVLGRDEVF
jgi:hypothetical protein